jgi:hypothetical protein
LEKIEIGDNGEITLKTTLTKGQVAKFNSLFRSLIIEDGVAYIPINQLHGVLLTNSKERAITIIENYKDIVKPFLTRDKNRFQKYEVSSVIAPQGLYNLLEVLASDNPKRANEYRASHVLLAYLIATHPQLAISSHGKAKKEERQKNSITGKLKRTHKICQLCEQDFLTNDEKHIHHIEGQSENPRLKSEIKNLIVIKGSIHIDYHEWARKEGLPISRATLKYYAKIKNYSLAAL